MPSLYKTYSERASVFCNLYTVEAAIARFMTQPSDRLRQARIRKGFDQAIDASSAYGWNRNTYSSNENGNAPFSFKSAQKYAAAFGVRAEWLYSGTGPMVDEEIPIPNGAIPVAPIPVIGEIAAGNWKEAVRKSTLSIPAPLPSMPPLAFALEVSGDSMDLLVEDGAMIIVDPGDRQFFHKRYYAVQNGEGETTFKQYMGDPARLVPCSSNPAHKEIILGDEPVTIIGRIIWRSSRM